MKSHYVNIDTGLAYGQKWLQSTECVLCREWSGGECGICEVKFCVCFGAISRDMARGSIGKYPLILTLPEQVLETC